MSAVAAARASVRVLLRCSPLLELLTQVARLLRPTLVLRRLVFVRGATRELFLGFLALALGDAKLLRQLLVVHANNLADDGLLENTK